MPRPNTGKGAIALRSVDNNAAIALASVPIEGLTVLTEQERSLRELGSRYKADQRVGGSTLSLSFESFYIRYEQETITSALMTNLLFGFAYRSAEITSDMYGLQLAIEAMVPITGPFSLIGRASAGGYVAETEGNFSSTFQVTGASYGAQITDEDSNSGYRLGGEAGVRYAMTPTAWLSVTGAVDYLSEAPTAIFPGLVGDDPAHIGYDELLDWRVGVRLTVGTP